MRKFAPTSTNRLFLGEKCLRPCLALAIATLTVAMAVTLSACAVGAVSRSDGGSGCQELQEQPSESSGPDITAGSGYYTDHPSQAGALRVEGTRLVGQNGHDVVLQGVSTHGLAWYPQYVKAELFSELSDDWNANVVRLALYSAGDGGYCTGGDRSSLRQLVLDGVDRATAADLYVIVDWHTLSDSNPLEHVEEAKELFGDLSGQLSDHDNVIYEICNEPNGSTTWADVKAYAQQVIRVIRKNDPDALVLVGTPEWCQRIDEVVHDPIDDDNVMYTLHFYAATHGQQLRQRLSDAVAEQVPVFVSEYGVCEASGSGRLDTASADAWLDELDELGVSRCMWSLSNKDEAASCIVPGCAKTSGFAAEDLAPAGAWLKERLSYYVQGSVRGESSTPAGDEPAGDERAGGGPAGQAVVARAADGKVATFESGGLSCELKVKGSWQAGERTCYQYSLSVTNPGEPVEGWRISIPFSEDVELTDGWNASFEANGSALSVSSVAYNGRVPQGASVVDIGFQVTASSELGVVLS